MHSTGASMFFIVVYLHMFRGLMYGSYRKPRELTWIFGCVIFLCLMAEAFFGYLLPWGQMSYWGAQVIVNLFSAVPFIGPDLSLLIRGDYVVGDATLNRFFSFHVIAVPLVLIGLVVAHIIALHEVGSNNPDGVEIKSKKDFKLGESMAAFEPHGHLLGLHGCDFVHELAIRPFGYGIGHRTAWGSHTDGAGGARRRLGCRQQRRMRHQARRWRRQ
jgi:quinol-cytochrome oxidoreductase complex cytochrome b subunit